MLNLYNVLGCIEILAAGAKKTFKGKDLTETAQSTAFGDRRKERAFAKPGTLVCGHFSLFVLFVLYHRRGLRLDELLLIICCII